MGMQTLCGFVPGRTLPASPAAGGRVRGGAALPLPRADGKDPEALHVFAWDETGVQAYLRVLRPGVSFPEASLGRVATRARGQGLGAELLRRGLKAAEAWLGKGPLRIEAQTYAKGFYEKFGFRQVSEEFLEDGILHIQMLRE